MKPAKATFASLLLLVCLILLQIGCGPFESARSKHRDWELEGRPIFSSGIIANKFKDTSNWGVPVLIIEVDTAATEEKLEGYAYRTLKSLLRYPAYYSKGIEERYFSNTFVIHNGFYCGLYGLWEEAQIGDTLIKVSESLEYGLKKGDTTLYFYPDCVSLKEIGIVSNPAFDL